MSLVTKIDNIFKKGVIGNVRKAQEDCHDMALKTPNGDVFVVCDGMGGHVGGAKASTLAVESIINYMKAEKYPSPFAALDGALQFANMQILGFASAHPEYRGMGTTACIVLMQSDGAYIAHVGDSRIYLFLGKEKQLHRITKDHSYVQTLVDAGKITDEEAEHHPNKNRILKALGVSPNLDPTFNYRNLPVRPKNGDIFLICSDGLCGMIPDSTIERVLTQNGTLEERGQMLINLAMEGETVQPGGQDNCTLELIQIDNSPWKNSEFKSYNPKKSRKKSGPRVVPNLIIIFIVISQLFVLGGLGAYFLYKKYQNNNQPKVEENIEQQIKRADVVIDSLQAEKQGREELLKTAKKEVEKNKGTKQKAQAQENVNNITKELQDLDAKIEAEKQKKESLLEKKGKTNNSKDINKKTNTNESNNNRKK